MGKFPDPHKQHKRGPARLLPHSLGVWGLPYFNFSLSGLPICRSECQAGFRVESKLGLCHPPGSGKKLGSLSSAPQGGRPTQAQHFPIPGSPSRARESSPLSVLPSPSSVFLQTPILQALPRSPILPQPGSHKQMWPVVLVPLARNFPGPLGLLPALENLDCVIKGETSSPLCASPSPTLSTKDSTAEKVQQS